MGTGAPTPTAARGLAVGLATAAGAVWSHHASGGAVDLLPGTFAVLASVAAGLMLTRASWTPTVRVLLLAAATQGAWHLLLTVSATPAHGAGHGSARLMLLTHVAAGLLSAAIAVGADRALVRLARAALDRWRVTAPVAATTLPGRVLAVAPESSARRTAATRTAPVRGPPAVRRPAPLARA